MTDRPAYLTKPLPSPYMPAGIPYIVGNEAAERFSFYGMVTILVVFMTEHLRGSDGALAVMKEDDAKVYYHSFLSAVYFFPILGALISDALLGKYRTILSFSIIYCLGHLALALDDTRIGLVAGLSLIAVGSGGIKPCVSAHVGDQFGKTNQHLLEKVFGWFYFAINFGSLFSTWLTPKLLTWNGPRLAFGVPGILMFMATVVFWLGRRKFVHIPPGGARFVRQAFSGEGLQAIAKLLLIYLFVAMFWALYNQTGSAWVLQAKKMDLEFLGTTWLPAQIQVINPILILIYMPLFAYVIYPAIHRVFPLTPLRKIAIGFFVTSLAFVVPAWIEIRIAAGYTPNVAWQLLAYAILTAAEVMVSITCLEFSYTQAPREMKSIIMAIFLLSISLGNLFTALVNKVIQNPDGTSKLAGADYYWFFSGLMAATAVLFIFVARRYREKTYIQPEAVV
jgi:proton-dependent oligopeptide transporter, POT family